MIPVRTGGARALAWVVIGVAGWLAMPMAPAVAHASLTGSDPQDGATVETLPDQVALEFSEEVASPAYVEVTAADGTEVGAGDPEVLGATVTLPLSADGPSGAYTIAYRVVSADGHPVAGELTFNVTTGPSPGSTPGSTPASAPPSAAEDDVEEGFFSRHAGHFGVAAVGLAAGALLVGMGLRARA